MTKEEVIDKVQAAVLRELDKADLHGQKLVPEMVAAIRALTDRVISNLKYTGLLRADDDWRVRVDVDGSTVDIVVTPPVHYVSLNFSVRE